MPSVSPLASEILTCCTALTTPRRVANSTVRSLTLSSGRAVVSGSLVRAGRKTESSRSRPPLRIDQIAQAVAEQVEAEHRDHQRAAGKKSDPPLAGNNVGRALRHHDPP